MANDLIDWTMQAHPNPDLRSALTLPHILPTDPGDPQPNPSDRPDSIYVFKAKMNPNQEISKVVQSLKKWVPEHPEKTVAVLTPIGAHGEKIVEALQQENIKVVEMLKSSESTRTTARIFEKIFISLADPSSQVKLANVFLEIHRAEIETPGQKAFFEELQSALKSCKQLEDYLSSPHKTLETTFQLL